jgi:hypothetical protein
VGQVRGRFRCAGVLGALGLFWAGWAGPAVAQTRSPASFQTPSEASGFSEYTSHPAMMAYLQQVQASSTEMRLGVYGESHEGRALPYAVFSRPAVTQPWEAWTLGRPILVLAAGVHGGERTLRESVLLLIRELATPGTTLNGALDDLVLIVVPQINPDGFSAPQGAMRGNLWELDLNRDYMKLEQPEIQGYVQNVLLEWAPHLFVDGHNGGSFPYNLNYQCPSHAEVDPALEALCDSSLFPAIDRKLASQGFLSWYYQVGTETRWEVGGSDPRIGRNYGGFANTVGVLFESPPSQSLADGVRSGFLAYETVIEWSRDNAALLMETVRDARIRTARLGAEPQGEIVLQSTYAPEERTVEYLIGVGQEARAVVSDSLMKRPVPTLSRPRPWAYLVPRDAEAAVALLRRHRISVEALQEEVRLSVEGDRLGEVIHERAYNHAAAVRLRVVDVERREVVFPKGTWVVRTGQMQGRLVSQLLEAESTDGVVYWNRMDAWLPLPEIQAFRAGEGPAPLFPIFRLMEPTPLPSRLP